MLDVLVIGAGPYGLAAAKAVADAGRSVRVLGKPMGFWRDHMPAGMFLRSGPGWHMDPAGELTFEAFCAAPPDPIPLELFLDYGAWFLAQSGLDVRDEHVTALSRDGHFTATLQSGETVSAQAVVAAPGVAPFAHLPEWAPDGPHTCDFVDCSGFAGARVLIVGGRQSAYEWAALASDHGAERIDVVHRHPPPRFEPVSWRFVDPLVEQTLAVPGWWRNLPAAERRAITRRFWEVGRLTLEPWLVPRLQRVHVHAGISEIDPARYGADRVVFATGYRAELARVRYLKPLFSQIAVKDGFPVLDEVMQTTVAGLYLPGFTAIESFGPFFGFVKGAPAAATLVARGIVASTKG